MADVSKFVETTISLLNLEREAEIEETKALRENTKSSELQRRGVCLLKLRIRSRCTGLYGRTMLSFETRKTSVGSRVATFPAHSFTPGDIAGLGWSGGIRNSTELGSGIVMQVTQTFITVAFDETSETQSFDDDGSFQLIKLANDVTYRRTKSALNDLAKCRGGPSVHLIDVLFGNADLGARLELKQMSGDSEYHLFNTRLNESQRAAVEFALSQPEVAIIHGPPGTGKTTTIIELILQAVKHFDMKVLACAPSNVAVDNMVEKLAQSNAKIVRLGHPARLLSDIQKYSLDAILSLSDATAIVQDVRRDIDKTLTKVRMKKDPAAKKQLRQEIKFLRKELKEREDKAVKEILKNADVILVTLTSASPEGPLKHLPEDHFEMVIIDEVAQALEASCWIPLLKTRRCILAGDHHQLPPTILSQKAAKQGLSVSLMERVIALHGDSVVHMLTTQYRMNQAIMEWPSKQLYHGRLTAHESVEGHLLKDLPGVKETENTLVALLLIDTAGCDVGELKLEDEVSKGNEGEADIVTAHVNALVDAGISPEDIAVISPYNLQVELIRLRLLSKYPHLEIKSVDGFQGREKEAVIISFVRSNEKGEVGFLAEKRRINVAITRARRHLAVVADSETVGRDAFLSSLLDYMSREGEVRSAVEYQDELVVGDTDKLSKGSETSSSRKTNVFGPEEPVIAALLQTKSGKNRRKGNETEKKGNMKCENPSGINTVNQEHIPVHKELSSKTFDKNVILHATLETSVETAVNALTREDLEKEIKNFLHDSSRQELSFPVTLSSQERFFVHSIAEEVGILHESSGDGDQRHVIIRKAPKKAEEDDDMLSTCPRCNKRLPTCNLSLHLLRCEQLHQPRPQSHQPGPTETGSGFSKLPKSSKKKKSLGVPTSSKQSETQDDFDEMIASFSRLNSECAFDSCRQSVRTLGEKCACCLQTYCLSHHIPEVHGCGAAAKVRARKLMAASAKHPNPKKLNASQKVRIQRKLNRKVEEMSDKRKPKRREEKK